MPYGEAHSDDAIPPQSDTLLDDASASDETACTNTGIAIDDRTGGNVTVIPDNGVVLD